VSEVNDGYALAEYSGSGLPDLVACSHVWRIDGWGEPVLGLWIYENYYAFFVVLCDMLWLMKKILVVSDGFFHPPLVGRWVLKRTLAGWDGYAVKRLRSLEQLPPDLTDYAALVLYLHHKRISSAALDRFEAYITGGGGVLAIHSPTASYKDQPRFAEILGGRFVGHGPVGAYTLEPISPPGSLFGDLPPFQVVDELYHHALQPDIQVHFTAQERGQTIPVVWTRVHGLGRVCYACPGHRAESLRLAAYQVVLRQGLAWVCGDG
jgi:type 1 glutamine amidotransferase